MNEKPKSIWKKSLPIPQLLLAWLGLMVVTMAIFVAIQLIIHTPFTKPQDMFGLLIFGAVSATASLAGWIFLRWLCCWRNFKRSLFALACFATLIALFYAVEDWRGWRTWENFRHQWEAKGERFDLASVTPPAVPDDQNFALTPVVATSYAWLLDSHGRKLATHNTNIVNRLTFYLGDISRQSNGIGSWPKGTASDLKPWQEYYRTLAATTNLFPVAPQPQTPAADVLLALSKYDETVEELREAAKLQDSRFPLEYDADCPAAILLPHLAPLKSTAQLLQLRALAELQSGESGKALEGVRLTMRLADSVSTEPILISHLVRIAILQMALQPVYEGLAEHRWSDAQLAELEMQLARVDLLADYRTAMRGEMVLMQIVCIQWLRRHPDQIPSFSGSVEGNDGDALPAPGSIVWRLVPTGWFYQNQYRCVRMMLDYYLPVVDLKQGTVSPGLAEESTRVWVAETKRVSPYNFLEGMLVPALSHAVRKSAYGQAAVNLARTAIALERYRLAHGEYPESLDALAPQFIAQVPHDVIGGGPLKYRLEANGPFVLYSVGWNETDDGGVLIFTKGSTPVVDIGQGDWVWRYPQK